VGKDALIRRCRDTFSRKREKDGKVSCTLQLIANSARCRRLGSTSLLVHGARGMSHLPTRTCLLASICFNSIFA
jgi:hypothetical protein